MGTSSRRMPDGNVGSCPVRWFSSWLLVAERPLIPKHYPHHPAPLRGNLRRVAHRARVSAAQFITRSSCFSSLARSPSPFGGEERRPDGSGMVAQGRASELDHGGRRGKRLTPRIVDRNVIQEIYRLDDAAAEDDPLRIE